MDERQIWRTIRKELEEIGITVAAFDANKEFILDWFQNAIATGAFGGKELDDTESNQADIANRLGHCDSHRQLSLVPPVSLWRGVVLRKLLQLLSARLIKTRLPEIHP